jgi:hypothetical protein
MRPSPIVSIQNFRALEPEFPASPNFGQTAHDGEFSSRGRIEGASLRYTYEGAFDGKQITGMVDLGEYGTAAFTATRRA